jgi:hypothetical protein
MARKNRLFRGFKKANMPLEVITVLIILVVFAIGGLFAHQIWEDLDDDIQANDDLSNTSKDITKGMAANFPVWLDNIFIFIFVLFVIFVLVGVFMIDSHPVFLAISVILLIGAFVVAIFLGNAYYDIASSDGVAVFANNMPFMAWIMNHIAEMMIGIAFMASVALYVKLKVL